MCFVCEIHLSIHLFLRQRAPLHHNTDAIEHKWRKKNIEKIVRNKSLVTEIRKENTLFEFSL